MRRFFSKKLCKKTVSVTVQGTPTQQYPERKPANESGLTGPEDLAHRIDPTYEMHTRTINPRRTRYFLDAEFPTTVDQIVKSALHVAGTDPLLRSLISRGASGDPIQMVGGYDEFSDRSLPDYWGGTSLQRWYRRLLRETMEQQGFSVYQYEWWHFDFEDWSQYRISNATFDEITVGR